MFFKTLLNDVRMYFYFLHGIKSGHDLPSPGQTKEEYNLLVRMEIREQFD